MTIIIILSIWSIFQAILLARLQYKLFYMKKEMETLQKNLILHEDDLNRLFENANETNLAINEIGSYLNEHRTSLEIRPWNGEIASA